MKGYIIKREHGFKPWLLVWSVKSGNAYTDTFRTVEEAKDYAVSIGITYEIVDLESRGGVIQ